MPYLLAARECGEEVAVEKFTIDIFSREQSKSSARQARRSGMIPGVAYHKGESPVNVSVSYKEFVRMGEKARTSQIFTLKSEIKSLNGKPALVKDVQREAISQRVIHLDFLTLKENEEIEVRIPIKVVGEAPGVKNDGGILAVAAHEVIVRCLPKNIPDSINVDVSALALGESIHARSVPLPDGVKLAHDPDETIISVVSVRTTESETTTAAAEGDAAAAATPAAAAGGKAAPAKAAPAKAAPAKGGK